MLRSQENLLHYDAAARPTIIAFLKQASADFRAAGGRFVFRRMMTGTGAFNAATKIIYLTPYGPANARFATVVEELLHFRQSEAAGVFGKPGGWLSRYTHEEWQVVGPKLEQEVDVQMRAMGFHNG